MSPESPDEHRDAPHWRRLEAEARLIALTMTDSERKRVMLFIADGYRLLAERAKLRDTGTK
jgi:plasmid stability protein